MGISFIDVGMGLELVDGSLGGILRVTASTPANRDQARSASPSIGGGADDIYASNIQVADLNALNAVLAIVKWKKMIGFYRDLETGNPLHLHDRRKHAAERERGMTLRQTLDHRFVERYPRRLEPGVLYISMEYATAAHSCAAAAARRW